MSTPATTNYLYFEGRYIRISKDGWITEVQVNPKAIMILQHRITSGIPEIAMKIDAEQFHFALSSAYGLTSYAKDIEKVAKELKLEIK